MYSFMQSDSNKYITPMQSKELMAEQILYFCKWHKETIIDQVWVERQRMEVMAEYGKLLGKNIDVPVSLKKKSEQTHRLLKLVLHKLR
ncbi:MAG: hypothetical protein HQK95_08630 [Nitrospirae bacterium]|nr:hypothetical protein [Nitrospirota bacterium]